MLVKLWGSRGSLPHSLDHQEFRANLQHLFRLAEVEGIESVDALRGFMLSDDVVPLTYGGRTTCTEVRYRGKSYVVDLGTGIVPFAEEQRVSQVKEYRVFVSHLHWDHVLGFPFFPQVYEDGFKIDIYHVHAHAPEYLQVKFNGVNFPVRWDELSAQICFHKLSLYRSLSFDDLTVTPYQLDHPGEAYGYRFETPEGAVGISVDNELQRRTPEELGVDRGLYRDLDVLLFDSQYELNELTSRYDWGHSSPTLGVDLAYREMIKTLVLTHHSPTADDLNLHGKLRDTVDYARRIYPRYQHEWKDVQHGGPRVISGHDGLEINVKPEK